MRLSISRRAQIDIDEIWIFIATESGSTVVADKTLEAISKVFRLLQKSPYAGRSREADLRIGLRSFPAGKYLIFYQVRSGVVQILRVIHGSRDLGAILEAN